jgi:hypothetical protein
MQIDSKTPLLNDELMVKLNREKEAAKNFQERRWEEWTDNYTLYRNKTKVNRLTQRQAVVIPLMKESIKTLFSEIDEFPSLQFKDKGGDRQKELYLQARWDNDVERINLECIDAVSKKTALLYGRTFQKLNFAGGEFDTYPLDNYDVLIDPLTSPLDIESARYITHQNIFKSLREILANDKYTAEGKEKLKDYINSKDALIQSNINQEILHERQERLKSVGLEKDEFQLFPAGDTIVNLTEHYTWLWDKAQKKFVRHVIVYANDAIRLYKSTLKEAIGVDFLPFVTWGEDIEVQDIWSDGPADLIRNPNKIVNVFFSQMIENRTLKNFQMHWFDSTVPNYVPQTYEPRPGAMLPAPGKPNEVISPVNVSGLEDVLTQIDFLTKLVERGTSATATSKGVSEKQQTTLGEINLMLSQAKEKARAMAKFYQRSYKELGMKYWQMLEANDKGTKMLYKTSSKGKVFPKEIKPADWISKEGYRVEVNSSSEQESSTVASVQKWAYIKGQFPDNPVVAKIAARRTLELVDLTPEELREIEEYEKSKAMMPQQPVVQQQPAQMGQQPQLALNA